MASKAGRQQSQRAYLKRRDALIEDLFLREGEEPRDIATKMLADRTLESESEESAIRTVRGVVAKIRKRIDTARTDDADNAVATNEIDSLERKLKRLREALTWQNTVAAGEPTENCARSGISLIACGNTDCIKTGEHVPFIGPSVGITITNTPQGPMTSYKALWPASVRQKAKKDASLLAKEIAELEIVLASKRAIETERGEGKGEGGGLTIIESELSIAELIEKNLSVN